MEWELDGAMCTFRIGSPVKRESEVIAQCNTESRISREWADAVATDDESRGQADREKWRWTREI